MFVWNPSVYTKFSLERLRPGLDLMARLPLRSQSPSRQQELPQEKVLLATAAEGHGDIRQVVDLGCGTGSLTAILDARYNGSSATDAAAATTAIVGIDGSVDMIETCKRNFANSGIQFLRQDIESFATDADAPRVDVIYSNAALHWIPNHPIIFPQLLQRLNTNGSMLAVQMPNNFAAPSHTSIRSALAQLSFSEHEIRTMMPASVMSPNDYYEILSKCQVKNIDIWETEYLHVLSGEDPVFHWTSGSALLPVKSHLKEEQWDQFCNIYKELLRNAYPKQSNGATLFSFRRLFVVATT